MPALSALPACTRLLDRQRQNGHGMFMGIVEDLGEVDSSMGSAFAWRAHRGGRVSLGDSIAVNGCCLTVVAVGDGWWEADVSPRPSTAPASAAWLPATPSTSSAPCACRTASAATWCRATSTASGTIVQSGARTCGCAMPARPAPLRGREGLDHRRRRQPHRGRAARDGFTVAVIPHTAAVTTLGHKGVGRPGEHRGRRAGQVRRAADC